MSLQVRRTGAVVDQLEEGGGEGEEEGGVSVVASSSQGVWQRESPGDSRRGDGEQKEKLLRYCLILIFCILNHYLHRIVCGFFLIIHA